MRIALFAPCFNDAFFPETLRSTVRVLERLGHDVVVPPGQTCCGQVHFNTGYRWEAGRLMRRFLSVFEKEEVVVAPSASCVAMVREQYPELAREAVDPGLGAAVEALAGRTYELTEMVVTRLGVEDVGAVFPHRVTFHPTCHSLRGIDVGDAPLRLLRRVRGLRLVDLPGARECCGFGGTFSVKNPHTSLAMMADKLRYVRDTGAEVLTAVDNSCLLHLMGGMRRQGWLAEPGVGTKPPGDVASRGAAGDGSTSPTAVSGAGSVRVLHLAEILACEGRP
jgi:L-lactate dehydrogenase complex protein LldE